MCVWLFLIFAEVGCPGLCDEYQSQATKTSSSLACLLDAATARPQSPVAGRQASDAFPPDGHQAGCADECFCHIQMLPSVFTATQKAFTITPTPDTVTLADAPTLTPEPPFLPPKSV